MFTTLVRPRGLFALVLVLAMSAGGCATIERPDPLEPMNRKVFAFNEGVDKVVLKPVAKAYQAVVPSPIRTGVSNFFSNIKDPWSAVNLMLQGRVKEGFSDVGRFATNTVVGVLGFVDVATGWGMPRHGKDFGQTLGVWGVDTGAYLVLPLLGPSDLRDTAALPLDALGHGQTLIHDVPVRNSLTVLQALDKRAGLLQAGDLLDDIALDKYLFMRDAFLQRRRSLVHDADPALETAPDKPAGPAVER
jgi:phospholipid-binding lipoprotein MlaA